MNKKIRSVRDSIIEMINDSSLPIEVVRLILAEIYTKVCEMADTAIAKEIADDKDIQQD